MEVTIDILEEDLEVLKTNPMIAINTLKRWNEYSAKRGLAVERILISIKKYEEE